MTGGSRSINCYADCTVKDSYVNDQYADKTGVSHESGNQGQHEQHVGAQHDRVQRARHRSRCGLLGSDPPDTRISTL